MFPPKALNHPGSCTCIQVSNTQLGDAVPWGEGSFGDALLAPTIIYVRPVLKLIQQCAVKVRTCKFCGYARGVANLPCCVSHFDSASRPSRVYANLWLCVGWSLV